MRSFKRLLPSVNAMVTFEAAARLKSFTAAAEELGVTQAAVSRQIRLLEDDLATKLFHRSHRRVDLTSAGAVLAATLSQSFEQIRDVVQVIRQPNDSDTLTIAATLAFSHFWLLPRLSEFRTTHPELKIRVVSEDTRIDLRSGGIDVAIRYGIPPFEDGQVVASRGDVVFPVCSPEFRDRLDGPVSPQMLPKLPLIASDSPDPTWLDWSEWFSLLGFKRIPKTSGLEFNHYTDSISAAMNGEGVALGWRVMLERILAQGRLVPLTEAFVESPASYHAITPLRGRPNPAADAFVSWIAASFGEDETASA